MSLILVLNIDFGIYFKRLRYEGLQHAKRLIIYPQNSLSQQYLTLSFF